MITLFHRDTDAAYDAPCDVADVAVLALDGQPGGYIGAAWGEHTPADVLHFHYCEPEDVDDVLAGWGLNRPEPPPIGGQG